MARFLYVVSSEASSQSDEVYEYLRRDLELATVELTYDRRRGERRQQAGEARSERRLGERRRLDLDRDLAESGWARVQTE